MTLKGMIADCMSSVFFNTDGFAVSAIYRAIPTDAGTEMKIMVMSQQDLGFASPGQAALHEIRVAVASCAHPRIHQTFTVDGVVYTVENIVSGNEHFWTLSASSDQRVSA